jgi:hypothetical protein
MYVPRRDGVGEGEEKGGVVVVVVIEFVWPPGVRVRAREEL